MPFLSDTGPVFDQLQKQTQDQRKQSRMYGTGFIDKFNKENVISLAYNYFLNNEAFPADPNYDPLKNPELAPFGEIMHLFMNDKSAAESKARLDKLRERSVHDRSNPLAGLGTMLGFLTDPSGLLLFSPAAKVLVRSGKISNTAKIGSAFTAEEVAKQYLDTDRPDMYVPLVAGLSFGLPAVMNSFKVGIPHATKMKVKRLDQTFNAEKPPKQPGYEDGKFIHPEERITPSSVGASVAKDARAQMSYQEAKDAEEFVSTMFGKVGEEGPWTPVFRTMKAVSKEARVMMGDLLDTPLLKLKNKRLYDFTSTPQSIELLRRKGERGVLQAQVLLYQAYQRYLKRVGQEVPSTHFGLMMRNRWTDGKLSYNQFAHEVSKARLNEFSHEIPEVALGARITERFVYKPIGEEMVQLGLHTEHLTRRIGIVEGILQSMKKKGTSSGSYKRTDGTTATYTKAQLEANLAEAKELLAHKQKYGGLRKNYINIIYNKQMIDKLPAKFKEIVAADLIRQGRTISSAALNQLVKDLSTMMPFVRRDSIKGNEMEMFVFQRPRFARATHVRNLDLTSQGQKELLESGFIIGDTNILMKTYYRQVYPDILLTRKYGDPNGLGYKYINEAESMTSPGLLQIREEYSARVFNAKTKKQKDFLIKEKNQVLEDLESAIELIRGTYGLPSNPHAWYSKGMRTMKHWNALTMLTGFMAAAPDVARVLMTSGLQRGFKSQFEVFTKGFSNGLFKMGKKEAQRWAEAIDMLTGQRAMLFSDTSDMLGMPNRIESFMGKASMFNFMYINMMSRWTEFTKSLASITIGTRIIEDSIAWGSKKGLSDKWKTALASSGIDEAMAARIAKEFNKHGKKFEHNYIANTHMWDDVAAADAFGGALNKDINITIVTPGLGDTPLWMSKELGSTIAQFKKFAMASTQRMLFRGMQERDLDFLFGSMMLIGSGMMIDGIYHKVRFQKDYNKLSMQTKLLNAFDRSGLAGIYTDINRGIEALTDNRIGIRPMLGDRKPYGTSLKYKGSLLGPSAGQLMNIMDIVYDVGGNQYDHYTARNVRRLVPFQNVWYLDWLFDDIEKGLR